MQPPILIGCRANHIFQQTTIPLGQFDDITAAILEGIVDAQHANLTIDEDEGEQLFGSTLRIVYDPEAELVHSFSISDFGDKKGTLSISISGDSLDPDLLDSSRVVGPNTRTFDVAALMALAEQFGK